MDQNPPSRKEVLSSLLERDKQCRELMTGLHAYAGNGKNRRPTDDLKTRVEAIMLIYKSAALEFSFTVDEDKYDSFLKDLDVAIESGGRKNDSATMCSKFSQVVVKEYQDNMKRIRRELDTAVGDRGRVVG